MILSTKLRNIGTVCCLHADPLKYNPQLIDTVRRHDVILGDLNTMWKHLEPHIGSTYHDVSFPSYFPSKVFDSVGDPPDFDHILLHKDKGSVAAVAPQIKTLTSGRDHRKIMQQDGWCSDHVPIEAHLWLGEAHHIRVATFNVADPFYFANFHPSPVASHIVRGFRRNQEANRLRHIRAVIHTLIQSNVIVALQEVPVSLAQVLRKDFEKTVRILEASDKSSKDLSDASEAPRLMMFVDDSELEPPHMWGMRSPAQ